MAELADALDSGSSGNRAGSNPVIRTNKAFAKNVKAFLSIWNGKSKVFN